MLTVNEGVANEVFTLIGCMRPPYPVNDFSPTIYFRNGRYYTHITDNNVIVDFSEVEIERSEIVEAKQTVRISKGSLAVFSFLFSSQEELKTDDSNNDRDCFDIISGEYYGVFPELINFMRDTKRDAAARLVISSFYKLHRETLALFGETINVFEEIGIDVEVHKSDFLTSNSVSAHEVYLLEDALSHCRKIMSADNSVNSEDLILIDENRIHIGDINFSIDLLSKRKPQLESEFFRQMIKSGLSTLDNEKISCMVKGSSGFFEWAFNNLDELPESESCHFEEVIDVMDQVEEDFKPAETKESNGYLVSTINLMASRIKDAARKEKKTMAYGF